MQLGRRPLAALPALVALMAVGSLSALPAPAEARAKARHAAHAKSPTKSHAKADRHAKASPRESRPEPEYVGTSLKPLSPKDARTYTAAFSAIRAGEFDAADTLARSVANPVLKGRLAYAKLMHSDYTASYDELADWLDRYRDQAGAESIYALARKKKPGQAAQLPPPEAYGNDAALWARVESLAERLDAQNPAPTKVSAALPSPASDAAARDIAMPVNKLDPKLQASREAYYAGDVDKAYALASKAGEQWIAGLAAFRMKRYDEARARFAALADDETENEWVRSGAGYWAARAAIASGAPEAAPAYLNQAARTPYTFYGLIAERQLGLDPGVTADGLDPALAPTPYKSVRTPVLAGPGGAAVDSLIRTDKRARRAAAFAQLGMKAESGAELRAGLTGSSGEARQSWTRLGLVLNAPITSPSDLNRGTRTRFNIAQYPTPDLAPDGGFTVEKALVYALVRQESKFDASAASSAGAYGLMQLMPATAARVAGDDKLKSYPALLKDPGVNLRVGQDYVARLLGNLNGDLLHTVAAYNSGPGVIQKTLERMGKGADSLLAIESMPGAQTREFVERVVAGYWIYRSIFGQESPTLSAAASHRRAISASLDQPAALTTAKLGPEGIAGLFTPTAAGK